MKEEWKVYIRGVQERGNEVIKALIDLGANNSINYTGDKPQYLYYINHNGIVNYTFSYNEYGQIIMDNYKEIKLPEQWSDGDILTRKNNNSTFCVYQKPVDNEKGFLCHVYVTKDVLFTEVTVPTESAYNYRKATDSEELVFYLLINNHHLCWDAEKKQLVAWKWKPIMGDKYWKVDSNGEVSKSQWYSSKADNILFDIGNCFQTKEEAEVMADKIKKLLKGES